MTLVDQHAVTLVRYSAADIRWQESVARNDPPLILAMRRAARCEARAEVVATWTRLAVHNAINRPCPCFDD